jgi:hypothetical protein
MATLTASTAQLLGWVAETPRTYAETIERWQTHCPRLAIWEDALADGLVRVVRGSVQLTSTGRLALSRMPTTHNGVVSDTRT